MTNHQEKWLNAKMDEIVPSNHFSILCEDQGSDYKYLSDFLLEACDFLMNYYENIPFFRVKCFADRESFSRTALREIDPGWMGAPVTGENNIIVLSRETFDETGDPVRFHSHLVHEISHICLHNIAWKNFGEAYHFPAWLDEGIALWLESEFRKRKYDDDTLTLKLATHYIELKEQGIFIPLSRMKDDLCLLDDPEKYSYGPRANYAYNKAFFAVKYIIDTCGTEIIFKKIPQYAGQKKLEDLFGEVNIRDI